MADANPERALNDFFCEVFERGKYESVGDFLAGNFRDHSSGIPWNAEGLKLWLGQFSRLRLGKEVTVADQRGWCHWTATAVPRPPSAPAGTEVPEVEFHGIDRVRFQDERLPNAGAIPTCARH